MTAAINIAIVGIGNCAKNFSEFLAQNGDLPRVLSCPGVLGRPILGEYERKHLRVAAAFDIDERKVGHDLSAALLAEPNCASAVGLLSDAGVIVERAPTLDSLTPDLRAWIRESADVPLDRETVTNRLRAALIDIVIVLVPSGSTETVRWWAETCVSARCSMINGTAAFVSQDDALMSRFRDASACYIGDDMKSQLGASVLHSSLLDLFARQGVSVESTSQVNLGGNADFANLTSRGDTKIASKSAALGDPFALQQARLHVGLHFDQTRGDEKRAVISIRGTTLCGSSVELTALLDVPDSGNTVAVLFDAVRCAASARDRGEWGYLDIPSARLMKQARRRIDDIYNAYEQFASRQ